MTLVDHSTMSISCSASQSPRCRLGTRLAYAPGDHRIGGEAMGRILLGVIIGVILVVWLLVSCLGAIF
jgi:hypothetical protein